MQSVLAVIDLKAVRHNARLLSGIAGRPYFAVVKDDGYGHGAAEIAHALAANAAGFAVATAREGAQLRIAGVTHPILIFTPPLTREEAFRMAAYDLTASVGSLRTLRLVEPYGLAAHIAVNTGMNRYGVLPGEAGALARRAKGRVRVTGVYSHLYAPENDAIRARQTADFLRAEEAVKRVFPAARGHLSATGGVLAGAVSDMVRLGIGLYGYVPDGFEDPGLRPAMRVYATVCDVRKQYGAGAGYNVTDGAYADVHTLRLGYGDGFFRESGPCIGKLCMDACIAPGREKIGRRVVVLKNAAQYAAAHRTTAYEVLVAIGTKAERRYLDP